MEGRMGYRHSGSKRKVEKEVGNKSGVEESPKGRKAKVNDITCISMRIYKVARTHNIYGKSTASILFYSGHVTYLSINSNWLILFVFTLN